MALATIAAGLAIASTAVQTRESMMAKKTAKSAASEEQGRIGEAKAEALSDRTDLINKQRRRIGSDSSFSTNKTGATGINQVNQGLLG